MSTAIVQTLSHTVSKLGITLIMLGDKLISHRMCLGVYLSPVSDMGARVSVLAGKVSVFKQTDRIAWGFVYFE